VVSLEIHYPNGKTFQFKKEDRKIKVKKFQYGNRGMTLEDDLNESNKYYLTNKIAVIHKKPTPIQIVQVDYPERSKAVIKEAYFKTPSTTDYNGVFRGKYIDFEAKETKSETSLPLKNFQYIDFEAKETKSETSLPLKNFHEHQIRHTEAVLACGGIAFVIIRFSKTEEIFLLEGEHLLKFWQRMESGGRKSITKDEIIQYGHQIPLGIQPRIDYIRLIESLYY